MEVMLNWVRINNLRDKDEQERLEREQEEEAEEEKLRLRRWGYVNIPTSRIMQVRERYLPTIMYILPLMTKASNVKK